LYKYLEVVIQLQLCTINTNDIDKINIQKIFIEEYSKWYNLPFKSKDIFQRNKIYYKVHLYFLNVFLNISAFYLHRHDRI
jgi:hypothetical protein